MPSSINTVNRKLLIPRRFERRGLGGLGDLIDEYSTASAELSNAYQWLGRANAEVTATNSPTLYGKWQNLLIRGEELRARAAKIHLEPSIAGFIENIFGAPTNVPIIGTIERAMSSDIAVYTADAQKYVSEVAQLKLGLDQYKRMIASGVSPGEASNAIESAEQGFFDKVTGALKFGGATVGIIALIAAAIIFMPEIKAGIRGIRKRAGR